MNQLLFVKSQEIQWQDFERMLFAFEYRDFSDAPEADFPKLYRQICHDLSIARTCRFDNALIDRLENLARRGHLILYKKRQRGLSKIVCFVAADFPQAVRREWRLVALAFVLFYGPTIFATLMTIHEPSFAYRIMSAEALASMEQMYDPSHIWPEDDYHQSRFMMFGFYIYNNIGIAFRTFGIGLFFGLGSIFIVVYNGLSIGAATGHVINAGFAEKFSTFVIAHGSVELNAIVLAGAGGMIVGWALLAPKNLTRKDALVESGKRAYPIVLGMFGMLVLAAAIEAFWSPFPTAPVIKYYVGAVCWILTALYFIFVGRVRR